MDHLQNLLEITYGSIVSYLNQNLSDIISHLNSDKIMNKFSNVNNLFKVTQNPTYITLHPKFLYDIWPSYILDPLVGVETKEKLLKELWEKLDTLSLEEIESIGKEVVKLNKNADIYVLPLVGCTRSSTSISNDKVCKQVLNVMTDIIKEKIDNLMNNEIKRLLFVLATDVDNTENLEKQILEFIEHELTSDQQSGFRERVFSEILSYSIIKIKILPTTRMSDYLLSKYLLGIEQFKNHSVQLTSRDQRKDKYYLPLINDEINNELDNMQKSYSEDLIKMLSTHIKEILGIEKEKNYVCS